MDKEQIKKELEVLIKQGDLTKEELLATYHRSIQTEKQKILIKQSRISNILYYLGGIVVFLGICIFVGTNWGNLSDITKIIVTLGSSIMIYFSGVLLSNNKKLDKVSDAFYFIAGLVGPLGLFITLDIMGTEIDTAGCHALVAAIVFGWNAISYYFDRRKVFLVFNVLFGTWFFFALTTFIIGGRPFDDWDFIKYRWLAAGLSHMFLGYSLVGTERKDLTRYLYGFGVLEFLSAAFVLGGWSPNQNVFWELIFPGLSLGAIFLSVYLKARSFLLYGTLFLMLYIMKITHEYFTSGFGWAFSLIITGFALIGIGYLAFYINDRYINAQSKSNVL